MGAGREEESRATSTVIALPAFRVSPLPPKIERACLLKTQQERFKVYSEKDHQEQGAKASPALDVLETGVHIHPFGELRMGQRHELGGSCRQQAAGGPGLHNRIP